MHDGYALAVMLHPGAQFPRDRDTELESLVTTASIAAEYKAPWPSGPAGIGFEPRITLYVTDLPTTTKSGCSGANMDEGRDRLLMGWQLGVRTSPSPQHCPRD